MSDDAKKALEDLERLNDGLTRVAAELERHDAALGAVVRVLDERLPAIKAQVDETKRMGDGFLDAKTEVQEFLRAKGLASVRDLDRNGMAELREFLERKLSFLRAKNAGRLD